MDTDARRVDERLGGEGARVLTLSGAWEGGARVLSLGERRASQALGGETQGSQQRQWERGGAHALRGARAATPGEGGGGRPPAGLSSVEGREGGASG